MTIGAQHLSHFLHVFPWRWNMLIDELCNYFIENDNGKVFCGAHPEDIRFLVAYHVAKGTATHHRGANGQIDGAALWYRWNSDWSFADVASWKPDNAEGDTLVVVWMLTDNRKATRGLIANWRAEHPEVEQLKIAGFRDGAVKNYRNVVIPMLEHENN